MKGRKPKPTHLHIVEGTVAAKHNPDEPMPDLDLGPPPNWMCAEEKELWQRVGREAPEGMLRSLDRSVLQVWVTACYQHTMATMHIREYGMVVKNPRNGKAMENPHVSIQVRMAVKLMKASAELGFSPTSRPRVKVEKGSRKKSAFDGLKELD
jgi:P27 family predicted phage terminase small subunit